MTSIAILSDSIQFENSIFWGCKSLTSIDYYGETIPIYSTDNKCYNEEIGCGNSTSQMNCSPF